MPQTARQAEVSRGALPPWMLAKPVLDRVQDTVEDIVAAAPQGDARSLDVKLALRDGRLLTGTVPGVVGDVLRTVTYSRTSPRDRLAAWVRLLALTAAHPDRSFEAVTVARAPHDSDERVAVARIAPLDAELALDHLAVLMELYDLGMREPAPLACRTSAAYAAERSGRRAQGVGVELRLRARGPGSRARARPRRRAHLRRGDGRGGAHGRAVGHGRDAPLRPLGAPALGRPAGARAMSFDVCGPLPTGVTVLEASAGTGKTYAIAALAARYIANGTPLDELLLVTFTRMATGELRERVRQRLVETERGLRTGEGDEVVELLADGPPEVVAQRRENLARALADFDAATIATTHGFCQEVLAGLGVAGDVERDSQFVEDVTDLVEEVVDDLYVRRFHKEERPPIDRAQAGRVARIAIENPVAPIEPSGAAEDSVPAMRARLAEAARSELQRRKERAGLMTYDDLLTRLDDILHGPAGEVGVRRLRERYRVVLVDEFQDTDPVQWSILRRAFAGGDSTLVLIGDPKQAIYAFRGADVYAYLDAAKSAGERATLGVNWRSDQGLIDAYDALFGGAKLGHEGIAYLPVRATEANQRPRMSGTPLRIRVVDRQDVKTTPRGYASTGPAREYIAKDLAADIVKLLNSGAEIAGTGPVRPGHVAVLVQTNRTAALIRDALDAAGVPAVINGAGSVFGTEPARHWLRLLEALERPTAPTRAHAAALTPFLGWSAERVATAGDEAWEDVHRRLHEWAAVLRQRGVASLAETIALGEGLPERILARVDGERALTDLRHVAELLHAAATAEQLGTTALVGWLRRRIAEAGQDTGDEDRSRRLESDEEAVQVLTVHRSKGLEFPVVYYPYLWDPSYIPSGVPVAFHDPDAGDRRTIDVGLEGPDFDKHKRQELVEQRGEDLRLAYVALTRAQHQAVVWWVAAWNCRDSALGRLLFAREADGTVPADGAATRRATRRPGRASRRCATRRRAASPSSAPSPACPSRGAAGAASRPS